MNFPISWQTYGTACAVAAAAYYAVIGLKYYSKRPGLKMPQQAANTEASRSPQEAQQPSLFNTQSPQQADTHPWGYQEDVDAFGDECSVLFRQLAAQGATKEVIIQALPPVLSKYRYLYDTQWRVSLLHLLQSESSDHCDIELTHKELSEAWLA